MNERKLTGSEAGRLYSEHMQRDAANRDRYEAAKPTIVAATDPLKVATYALAEVVLPLAGLSSDLDTRIAAVMNAVNDLKLFVGDETQTPSAAMILRNPNI